MSTSQDGWEGTEVTAVDTRSQGQPVALRPLRELGASHRTAPPVAAPSAARPSWEGAYLCSPNLESIEAEWLHFKRNYYKPFRECEFQNEISLSKLSLMRRCCAGIGLHPCLRALNGDQILGGAAHTGSQSRPAFLPPSTLRTPKNLSPKDNSLCLGNVPTQISPTPVTSTSRKTHSCALVPKSPLNSNHHRERTHGGAQRREHATCVPDKNRVLKE